MSDINKALQSILTMEKSEVQLLAERLRFFSPSKAEALEFALWMADREHRDNEKILESLLFAPETVR